jgi:hypothetical protein
MKQLITICTLFTLIPIVLCSQTLSGIDYISPFHDNLAAVKKGTAWGFMDRDGNLVIDFRNDLVVRDMGAMDYPVFNSGRCLIKEMREGIAYFGYINKDGITVLEPQFLNATDFNDGLAIILKLYKNVLGQNDVLDKSMITYDYMELAIDPKGEIIHYISEKPTHITLARDFMNGPPEIRSKFLTQSLLAIRNSDNTWSIKKV